VLRSLKSLPDVVILHRGVDEETHGNKMLPIHMINKIKGTFNVMISIAGGDTEREIQSSVFNGADIVVLWKNFYEAGPNTGDLAQNFLNNIK
jgi:3-keto-L-gulonate-6-phosphate decarboxylase